MSSIVQTYSAPFGAWEVGVRVRFLTDAHAVAVSGWVKAPPASSGAVEVKLTYNNNPFFSAHGYAPNDLAPVPVAGNNYDLAGQTYTHLPANSYVLRLTPVVGDVDPEMNFIVTIVELDPMAAAARKSKARKSKRR